MKRKTLLVLLLFLFCLAFSCQKQPESTVPGHAPNAEEDIAAVRHAIERWTELYNAGDFDTIMSELYADQAVLMSPNVPMYKGKAEILRAYQRDAKVNDEHVDSSVIEDVRVSGNMAVARGEDTGTTAPKSGGESIRYSLKWLIVLERQPDGSWKYVYEIWNDNSPAPTGEAL